MAFDDGNGVIVDRTRNALVFSQGANPPACGYIPDPNLPKLFEYKFGGSGYIVIPKGRIVAVNTNTTIKSPETGKSVNPLTIADGTNIPIGVAATNVYELNLEAPFDMVYGVLTNDTIEVPIVDSQANADAFPWACAYGDLKAGDRVKPDPKGHFVKWVEKSYTLSGDLTSGYTLSVVGDSEAQKVGVVYEIDKNIPPEGWIKWAELPKTGDFTDPAYPIGWTSAQRAAAGGYPYDPAYRTGFASLSPSGINGLTNGYYIEVAYNDEQIGIIPAAFDAAGKEFSFRLAHFPVVANSVSIKVAGIALDSANFTVDLASGLVILTLPADWQHPVVDSAPVDAQVTATYSATGQIPGVPSSWDVKGLLGVARIKLTL